MSSSPVRSPGSPFAGRRPARAVGPTCGSAPPQLAEPLSLRWLALQPGALLRPLQPGDRCRAVRDLLVSHGGEGRLLTVARSQRGTAGLLEETFAELEEAAVPADASPAALTRGGQEVVGLYRRYRMLVPGLLASPELLGVATQAVRADMGVRLVSTLKILRRQAIETSMGLVEKGLLLAKLVHGSPPARTPSGTDPASAKPAPSVNATATTKRH